MKFCPKCNTHRPEAEFHKAARRKDGLQSYCKHCKKSVDAQTYIRRGEEYKRWKRQKQLQAAKRNARLVFEYLQLHPCVDCGETDLLVLEFDHVKGEKKYNIADGVNNHTSWDTIRAEIEKCEVRCANCHRRVTAIRIGSKRLQLLTEYLELGRDQS